MHPAFDRAGGLAAIGTLQFVTLSRRGQLFGRFDQQRRQQGLQRRVISSLPTVSAVIDTLAASDLVAVMPPEVCTTAMARDNIAAQLLPVVAEPVPVVMSWHRRTDSDPEHRWLRTMIERAWNTSPI